MHIAQKFEHLLDTIGGRTDIGGRASNLMR
jgi:hypothetical protein